MTKCAYHSEVDAVTSCVNCGRLICPECKVVLGEKIYCNPCAEEPLSAKAQVEEGKPDRVWLVTTTPTEVNGKQMGVTGNISWREPSVSKGGPFTIECHRCKEVNRLAISAFSPQSVNREQMLTHTNQNIVQYRPPILGYLMAIVIAFIIGGILMAIFPPLGIFAIVVIVLSGGRILNNKFATKLPVWYVECKKCGNKIPVASDGTVVAVGEIHLRE